MWCHAGGVFAVVFLLLSLLVLLVSGETRVWISASWRPWCTSARWNRHCGMLRTAGRGQSSGSASSWV